MKTGDGPIRISIVEDNLALRKELTETIAEGTDIVCISEFDFAEQAASQIPKENPDIVIMDIELRDLHMSGIQAMVRIREANSKIQFMMLTIFDSDDKVFESLKAGATGYILKREPIEKILNAVRELKAGGAPMSGDIARKVLQSFHQAKPFANTLTSQEEEVLKQLSKGLLYKEIANNLGIEVGAVKQRIHRIYVKLHVANRTEAIRKYLGFDPI